MPKVSIIIPSMDGYRDGNVPKLKESLSEQTYKDFEIHVVVGISPNGRARNEGVKRTTGEILVFIDDDVTFGNDRVVENRPRIIKKEIDNILDELDKIDDLPEGVHKEEPSVSIKFNFAKDISVEESYDATSTDELSSVLKANDYDALDSNDDLVI